MARTRVALVDTHTLLWAASGITKKLGKRALRVIQGVEKGDGVLYVSTLSLVEVGEVVRLGKITFAHGFEQWVRALLSGSRYQAIDLTVAMVLRAQALYAIPERGDRLIAATAAELGCPLLTRDPEIAAAAGVDVIW